MTRQGTIRFVIRNLIWFLLLAVVIFFNAVADSFLTTGNFVNILFNASVMGVLVVGQTFTLLTGNFDLSMESTLGLCGLLGIWLITAAGTPYYGSGMMLPVWLSVVVLLAVGVGIGYINGWLITVMRMNNFVVTLAMLIIIRGVTLVLNNGQTAYSINPAYNWLGLAKFGPVPVPVVLMAVVFVIAYIITTYTPFGRELFAVGANRNAARASGVRPGRRILHAYMISGLLAALAGWMLSARLTNAASNLGEGMVFEVFAAAVIGGVSLRGGQGSIIGALGGVLLLATINAGLNLMNVSVYWVQAIRGMIILLAMLIDAQKVRYIAPAAPAPSLGPARST